MICLEPLAPQSRSLLGPIHRDQFPFGQICALSGLVPAARCHHQGRVVQTRAGSGTFQGWNYIESLEGAPKHNIPSPPAGLGLAMRSGLGPASQGCVGVIPALGRAPHGIHGESGEGFTPSCVLVWGFVMISWQGISVRNQRQEQKKGKGRNQKKKNPTLP